jgi:hypothetical protein
MTKKEHIRETKRLTALRTHWEAIRNSAHSSAATATKALHAIQGMQEDLDADFATLPGRTAASPIRVLHPAAPRGPNAPTDFDSCTRPSPQRAHDAPPDATE